MSEVNRNTLNLPTLEEMKEHECEMINSSCFHIVLSNNTYITLFTDYKDDNELDEMARIGVVYLGVTMYKSPSFDDFDNAKEFIVHFIKENSLKVIRTDYS